MIRKANPADIVSVTQLALELWPDNEPDELYQDFSTLLTNNECAAFLAFAEEQPIGLALCQLRHDYVEGTDSSPVGYLEGIYIREDFRLRGYARALLQACEEWSAEIGCTEFASDCPLTNETSLRFHLKVGFIEANRIICFTKQLSKE